MPQDAKPFALVVRFTVRPGAEAQFDALVAETAAGIRDHEPGTLVYACHAGAGPAATADLLRAVPGPSSLRGARAGPLHTGGSSPSAARSWKPPRSTSLTSPMARRRSPRRWPATMPDDQLVGKRIAYHRKRLGLSQIEFAGLVGRSESWVSQVERGVRPVDRMSVLQRVADVLSVSVAELRGDDEAPDLDERPEAFDTIRLALTGHPAIGSVLGTVKLTAPARQMDVLQRQHADVWELVHGSRYAELAPILAALIPGLETATRTADSEEVRDEARELLGDTYQATAAMMVKIGETDAAWIAADRAGFCAETAGSPLAVAAACSGWHTSSSPSARSTRPTTSQPATAAALEPKITSTAEPEVLSLYGALHLVLAVAAARDNKRREAREHLDTASQIADQLGQDRDDYGTEFGPTNVAIHAVSIAVELGDAGQAIELGHQVKPASLSPERQARYLLDLAQAHAMRRQIGEALHALQEAERIAPEETRVHYVGRAVTRELLQLSGLRPRPELRDLAERFGVLP